MPVCQRTATVRMVSPALAARTAVAGANLPHLSAVLPPRKHVWSSPHVAPLLQRWPGIESDACGVLAFMVAVEVVARTRGKPQVPIAPGSELLNVKSIQY